MTDTRYTEEECVRADMARDDMKDAAVQPQARYTEHHEGRRVMDFDAERASTILRSIRCETLKNEMCLGEIAEGIDRIAARLDDAAPWICTGDCGRWVKVTEFGECAQCGEEAKHRDDIARDHEMSK